MGRRLNPVSRRTFQVFVDLGEYQMWKRWRRIEIGRTGLSGQKQRVITPKHSRIEGEPARNFGPLTRVITENRRGPKKRIACDVDNRRSNTRNLDFGIVNLHL